MSVQTYSSNRSHWIPGPWNNEPDIAEFDIDGFHCLAKRDNLGAWCGYVQVPETHKLYKNEKKTNVGGYGGTKFVGELAEETGWWIGFACAEPGDLVPGLMKFQRASLKDGKYRNLEFVKARCGVVVAELKKIV